MLLARGFKRCTPLTTPLSRSTIIRSCSQSESESEKAVKKPKNAKKTFQSTEFQQLLRNPEEYKELIYQDEMDLLSRNICLINHPFPKAKRHVMVLPTGNFPNWSSINETNVHILYEMKEKGLKVKQE